MTTSMNPGAQAIMLLQSVRPNIVQSIRAFRPEDLQLAANAVGQHFLYTNLSPAQNKQDVLDIIARDFLFPDHFGKNLDALYDCITDTVHKSGPQPGFVVVLELLPKSKMRCQLDVLAVANGQRVPEDWHRLSANALVQRAFKCGGELANHCELI